MGRNPPSLKLDIDPDQVYTRQEEEEMEYIIFQFVRQLSGRFDHLCSDSFLTALISKMMVRSSWGNGTPYGKLILQGDDNAAYEVSQFIFEIIMEHGCKERMNGHHVAQNFCEFISSRRKKE